MAGELKPTRVRPAIRRIAIWVTSVLLLIAAWQLWDAIEARRLERALAPIVGPPVPTKIFASARDEGAGKFYAAAAIFAVSVKPGERLQPVPGGPIVDPATAMRDVLARGGLPPKQAIDEASQEIERARPVFELLSQASALPMVRFAPGTEFNYRFSGLLDVNRLAGLETMHLAMSGRGDQAARTVIDRLASLRTFDNEPSIVSRLKTRQVQEIATDIGILMSQTTASEDRLIDLDRALSRTSSNSDLERSIRDEMLRRHGLLQSIWGRPSRAGIRFLLRPVLRHQLVDHLETTAEALVAARLPWPDRVRAMEQVVERRSMLPTFERVFGEPVAPGFRRATILDAEGVAALRCARLVIAIERYRRARKSDPAELTDVASPGDEVMIDPFTGKALRYARSETAYVVYSVGPDGKDEGGTFSSTLPAVSQPGVKTPPIDIGVRVRTVLPASSRVAQP